jgi:hypothetical protein
MEEDEREGGRERAEAAGGVHGRKGGNVRMTPRIASVNFAVLTPAAGCVVLKAHLPP